MNDDKYIYCTRHSCQKFTLICKLKCKHKSNCPDYSEYINLDIVPIAKNLIIKLVHQRSIYFSEDISKILPAANLKDDLNLDSLDVIEISVELESKFSFKIPDEDFNDWVTVQDVISTVTENINKL